MSNSHTTRLTFYLYVRSSPQYRLAANVFSLLSFRNCFISCLFQRLNKVSPVLHKGHCTVASYPENREKNRSPDILARELDFSFNEKMCFHPVIHLLSDFFF